MIGYQLDNTLSDFGYVSRGVCEVDEYGNLSGVTERTHIQRKNGGIVFTENETEIQLQGTERVSMNMVGFFTCYLYLLSTIFCRIYSRKWG